MSRDTRPTLAPGTAALLHGSPSAVLARIVPNDPLGLRARIAAECEGRALLFDVERALLHVQALVALLAGRWRGEPALEEWVTERVKEGLEDVLQSEASVVLGAGAAARLCAPLELDAARLGGACSNFNRLPEGARRAFFALVLEGASPDGWARRSGRPLGELLRVLRRALEPFRAATSVRTGPAAAQVAERRA
jgi:hypothetical protein